MLPKYTVEFIPSVPRHSAAIHYSTDDPVACEQFVEELLVHGFRVAAIKHEGLALPKHEFDRIVKTAASAIASKRICVSLGIKPDEEKFRFGFSA